MSEYDAFHYLMHKEVAPAAVNYVTGPAPLTFPELFSPREGLRPIGKEEKSYWRTRDRIQFTIFEDRAKKLIIITCKSAEADRTTFRTIFLDCSVLYFELQYKARGSREAMVRKAESKFASDAELDKAFVSQRLNISAEAIEWPALRALGDPTPAPAPAPAPAPDRVATAAAAATPPVPAPAAIAAASDPAAVPAEAAQTQTHLEWMAVFMLLTGDEEFGNSLEVSCPDKYDFGALEHIKAFPPAAAAPGAGGGEETPEAAAVFTPAAAARDPIAGATAAAPAATAAAASSTPAMAAKIPKATAGKTPINGGKGKGGGQSPSKTPAGSGAAAVKAAQASPAASKAPAAKKKG
jgi:hypothetical protein